MQPTTPTPTPADEPIDDLASAPAAAELLALASAEPPPAALRGRVLEAATAARAAGRPPVAVDEISPVESFRRTLADLGRLVATLTPDDATSPTIDGWTVAGLLGHLTAIEEHLGATLGWWPEAGPIEQEHDHRGMTLPAVHAAQSAPFEAVRARWAEVVERVTHQLPRLESRLDEPGVFHGIDFSIRSLLIARSFEVWTHSEDIARAVGRPLPVPDVARLRLMTDAAVRALPIGMLLTGREPRGRSVRIVLTGDGGGAWVQPLELGGRAGPPDLTLVTDAVEFCRVAAMRTRAADLECSVIGDPELGADVLAAVAVFAA